MYAAGYPSHHSQRKERLFASCVLEIALWYNYAVAIFLGVDGGGSKTSCLIGDETAVLATGVGGGSNVVRFGIDRARESLRAAIVQACEKANVNSKTITRTCIGVAGAGRPEAANSVRRLLQELVGGSVEVTGDMQIAHAAAFNTGPGLIVVAGTGSVAYGRNARGQTARAGGWGHAISDEGSGHWIGRAALAAAFRFTDEGRSSSILQRAPKYWSLNSLDELVIHANAPMLPDFAQLFPLVLEAAAEGDHAALDTLERAGEALAALAWIVVQRIFPGSEAVPAAMAGGVFRNSARVRDVFYNCLHAVAPSIALLSDVVDPVKGALELARMGGLHDRDFQSDSGR